MDKIIFGTLDTTDPDEIALMEKVLEEKSQNMQSADNSDEATVGKE